MVRVPWIRLKLVEELVLVLSKGLLERSSMFPVLMCFVKKSVVRISVRESLRVAWRWVCVCGRFVIVDDDVDVDADVDVDVVDVNVVVGVRMVRLV
jgi:hypothetical protein